MKHLHEQYIILKELDDVLGFIGFRKKVSTSYMHRRIKKVSQISKITLYRLLIEMQEEGYLKGNKAKRDWIWSITIQGQKAIPEIKKDLLELSKDNIKTEETLAWGT